MGRCKAGALRIAIFSLPYNRPANLPAKSPGGSSRLRVSSQQSNQAERGYLASEPYRYVLAYKDSQLAGCIAIRDGSHLFHLFVERSYQRQGIARRLWERALKELCVPNSDGGLQSTRAFPPCRYIKPSASFRQVQYRVCMASRFCRCDVRHCSRETRLIDETNEQI